MIRTLKQSSGWTPPPGKDEELDCYINTIERHIDQLPRKHPHHNPDEKTTLSTLKNNTDIIIKPADKGGAIVILNKTDYMNEANRQLNNAEHYLPVR